MENELMPLFGDLDVVAYIRIMVGTCELYGGMDLSCFYKPPRREKTEEDLKPDGGMICPET